jgi:hypothetical protein
MLRKSTGEVHKDGKVLGHKCGRCAGTGMYVTMVLNGKPTGPGGECYRCDGKGYQTPKDEARNVAYDNFSAARSMRVSVADYASW